MQAHHSIVATNLKHLKTLVSKCIEEHGPACNLNHIDVSNVPVLDYLFHGQLGFGAVFQGDISQWNVANATSMYGMFTESIFNGDIAKWNVANVKNMQQMFAHTNFTGDIASWDVGNAQNMDRMFAYSAFNGDLSKWNVHRAKHFTEMFLSSLFNGDISLWRLHPHAVLDRMLHNDVFSGNLSTWTLNTGQRYHSLFSPKFSGRAPQIEENVPTKEYGNMFGNKMHLENYLERAPFDFVHADWLLRGEANYKGMSDVIIERCQHVVDMGSALGMNRAELCRTMVQQVRNKDVFEASMDSDLFVQR